MEALIGIVGADFVILAADRTAARSIVVMKGSENKLLPLGTHSAMAYCGEPGDAVQFAEYVQRNVQLYQIRNGGIQLGTKAVGHFVRRQLADSLRSRSPYSVNMLIGGCDSSEGPRLYWIDYLASLVSVPFAAHGHAAYFCLSLMDRHYRPGMGKEEALGLLKTCLAELKTRYIVNLPQFTVNIISSAGTEELIISA